MDKLTNRCFESDFCLDCPDYGEPNGCNRSTGTCDAYEFCQELWDKLAAYEDTGMDPGEVLDAVDLARIAMMQIEFNRLKAENALLRKVADAAEGVFLGEGEHLCSEFEDAMDRLRAALVALDGDWKEGQDG